MKRDPFISQRGISMMVVVVVVVITIILSVTSLLLYARLGHFDTVQKNLLKVKKQEEAAQQAVFTALKLDLEPTGLRGAESDETTAGRPADELKKRQDVALASMEEKFRIYKDENLASLPEDKRTEIKARGESLKALETKVAEKCREIGIYGSLQDLVKVQALRMLFLKNLSEQLRLQEQMARTHLETLTSARQRITTPKEDYKALLNEQTKELNKKFDAEAQHFTARKQELTTASEASDQGLQQETARFYEFENKMKTEIGKLQLQLEELKVKEAIKYDINTIHGHVLRPDAEGRSAFISIGQRDRVVPGLKFIAAKRGNQGKLVYKAELLVKKVWPTHSEVAITNVLDAEMPVVDGDVIINPLFNTRRAIVVAFAGEETPIDLRPAWDVKEASRRIRDIGSEVRPGITLELDFLIFTEARQKGQPTLYANFNRAAILGIPYEEAKGLYRFLGE